MITEALQAFTWVLKFPLPSLAESSDQLTKTLFVLLKDYAKAGAARGENFNLVVNCFKVIQWPLGPASTYMPWTFACLQFYTALSSLHMNFKEI